MLEDEALEHVNEGVLQDAASIGAPTQKPNLGGVFVGRLIGIEGTVAEVLVPGLSDDHACQAAIVGELSASSIGSDVAVMFAGGDEN